VGESAAQAAAQMSASQPISSLDDRHRNGAYSAAGGPWEAGGGGKRCTRSRVCVRRPLRRRDRGRTRAAGHSLVTLPHASSAHCAPCLHQQLRRTRSLQHRGRDVHPSRRGWPDVRICSARSSSARSINSCPSQPRLPRLRAMGDNHRCRRAPRPIDAGSSAQRLMRPPAAGRILKPPAFNTTLRMCGG
jgi:hypothetical protein